MPLADIENYQSAIQALRKLFGKDDVETKLGRLGEIFVESERCWEDNLELFGKTPIGYLLLAEAPPWRKEGQETSYFYRNFEQGRANFLRRAVWKCFFKERPLDYKNGLRMLAKRGFILIDALPFAMKYTPRIRRKLAYKELLEASNAFMVTKLSDNSMNWDKDVKLALAFKLFGQIAVNAVGTITLPTTQQITLDKTLIAADRAGYTNAKQLRRIFFDSEKHSSV
jgi:hypothetical protein